MNNYHSCSHKEKIIRLILTRKGNKAKNYNAQRYAAPTKPAFFSWCCLHTERLITANGNKQILYGVSHCNLYPEQLKLDIYNEIAV